MEHGAITPGSLGSDGSLYSCRCARHSLKRGLSDADEYLLALINDVDYDEEVYTILVEAAERGDDSILDALEKLQDGFKDRLHTSEVCLNGWALAEGSQCRCEEGYAGEDCNLCGPPLAPNRVYVCSLDSESREYVLKSQDSRYLDHSANLPGRDGLDCQCMSQVSELRRWVHRPPRYSHEQRRESYMMKLYKYMDDWRYRQYRKEHSPGSAASHRSKHSHRSKDSRSSSSGGGGLPAWVIILIVLGALLLLLLLAGLIYWCYCCCQKKKSCPPACNPQQIAASYPSTYYQRLGTPISGGWGRGMAHRIGHPHELRV